MRTRVKFSSVLMVVAAVIVGLLVAPAMAAGEEPVRVEWTTWPKSWGQVKLWSPEPAVGSATFEVWSWSSDGFRRLGEYTIDVLSGPGGKTNTARWSHPTACGVTGSVKLTRYPGWGGGYAFGCVVATPAPPAPTSTPRPPTATPRSGEPTVTPSPVEPTPTPGPQPTPYIPPADLLCYGPGSAVTLGDAVRPGYVVVAEYRYYNGDPEGATIWEGVHKGLKGELKLLPGHAGLDWGFVALKAFPPSVMHNGDIVAEPLGAYWRLYRVTGHFPPDYRQPIFELISAGWANVVGSNGEPILDEYGQPYRAQHVPNCTEVYFRVNDLP